MEHTRIPASMAAATRLWMPSMHCRLVDHKTSNSMRQSMQSMH
jgi:hypothetical protein